MSKILLNFYGEIIPVEKTSNLSSLRSEISKLLCFSSKDAEEIIMTYTDQGKKLAILNDTDLNTFLNSQSTTIDLGISQQSKIYKENLNQLQEEIIKDKDTLKELIKKNEELEKLKQTKFISLNQEIGNIRLQIDKLIKKQKELIERQNELENQIFTGMKQIDQEKREKDKKIVDLQKKLGIPPTENRKPKKNPMDINTIREHNKINKSEFDYKIGAEDNFDNNIFEKQEEKANKLNEKFKNLSLNSNDEEDKKEEEKEKKDNKKTKEIHYGIICNGCRIDPLVGKRYKCTVCKDFDFCENCYERNKANHFHEFELIEKSQFPNVYNSIKSSFNLSDYGYFDYIFPFFQSPYHHNKKRKRNDDQPNINNTTFSNPNYKNIHFGVQCDGCGVSPIIGTRYKCCVCDNFDYCEQCEKKYREEHYHKFQKL